MPSLRLREAWQRQSEFIGNDRPFPERVWRYLRRIGLRKNLSKCIYKKSVRLAWRARCLSRIRFHSRKQQQERKGHADYVRVELQIKIPQVSSIAFKVPDYIAGVFMES